MKNLFIKNPNDGNVGFLINKQPTGVVTNNGPDGSIVVEEKKVNICLAFPVAIPPSELHISGLIELTGRYVVQVGDVIVPHVFKAEDLGKFFNEEDTAELGIAFVEEYRIKNLKTNAGTKVSIYKVDKDGTIVASGDFSPLDPIGVSFGISLAPAPELVTISCADVPNETQQHQLRGLFKVIVDDVELLDGGKEYTVEEVQEYYIKNGITLDEHTPVVAGRYWTQDEIAIYFDANQTELGVTVDYHYVISCAGAPTKTACLTIDGEWDVYIDEQLVASDITIDSVVNVMSSSEVIAESCVTAPTATSSATSQLITTREPTYNLEIKGIQHTGISEREFASILNSFDVEVIYLTDVNPM